MRLAWAIVAGAAGAGVLAWWLSREDAAAAAPAAAGHPATASAAPGAQPAGPTLYRWRDDAGIVQITDVPPKDRDYTLVDVAGLERRNTIHPDPMVTEAR